MVVRRSRAAVLLGLAALVGLGACVPATTTDAQAAVQRFQTALRGHDPGAACGMLSEEARSSLELTSSRPCPEALRALSLPTGRPTAVQVWGDNAQARLPGGALFLAEFTAGWKITGAGCRPRTDQPYACAVRS